MLEDVPIDEELAVFGFGPVGSSTQVVPLPCGDEFGDEVIYGFAVHAAKVQRKIRMCKFFCEKKTLPSDKYRAKPCSQTAD